MVGERRIDGPTDQHREVVRRETLTGAIANALVALLVAWFLFRGQALVPVLGTDGAAFGIVPGTFMFTLGLTIGLTLSVRSRVRQGRVPRLARHAGPGSGVRLPGNVVVRGIALALVAELALVPATLALLGWLAPAHWSFAGALIFNAIYFVVLSLLVVPVVVWQALRDGP